ncbi:hypothetical protein [Daejeonella sp.]|jgi:hypothetical protein|uniref:hypothetical protein n=1 Tax=Daejeonella sp. TaxID=2805397 RepID=UPI0037844B2D
MLKRGKEEIIYLLNKSIEKFEIDSQNHLNKNTNKKNYEPFAIMLSSISNALPFTSEKYGHIPYEIDTDSKKEYSFRKYDITGGQIRDALMGSVSNPRQFIIDSCYIYLYGQGRLSFEKSPTDLELIAETEHNEKKNSFTIVQENQQLKSELFRIKSTIQKNKRLNIRKSLILVLCTIVLISTIIWVFHKKNEAYEELIFDYNIKPYSYTQSEKKALEGIWLNYIGSPQARSYDVDRENLVVLNITEIKEKNGYFICTRYGSSFNHAGYAQFESPNVVSIHLKLRTPTIETNSPRHTLLLLDSKKTYINAISASWNFDVGNKNKIIGIREVYKKLGKGGELIEILNAVENGECKCKIIKWVQKGIKVQEFHLKNLLIDTIKPIEIRSLIDFKSILLKDLEDSTLIRRHK